MPVPAATTKRKNRDNTLKQRTQGRSSRNNQNKNDHDFKGASIVSKILFLLVILVLCKLQFQGELYCHRRNFDQYQQHYDNTHDMPTTTTTMTTNQRTPKATADNNNNIVTKNNNNNTTSMTPQTTTKPVLSDPEYCTVDPMVLKKFNDIYEQGFWGPNLTSDPGYYYSYAKDDIRERKSSSGFGSEANCMSMLGLEFLSKLIITYNISSMLDIPCGDVNWQFESWQVDSLPQYVGADVSSLVIDLNRRRFAHHSNKEFFLWDLTKCKLPKLAVTDNNNNNNDNTTKPFDLIHTRDVLQHLPLPLAQKAVQNIMDSQAKFLVTTTFPKVRLNRNVETGGFYQNNLDKPPFHFPSPLQCVQSHVKGCRKYYEPDITCLYDLNEMRRNSANTTSATVDGATTNLYNYSNSTRETVITF